MTRDAGLAGCTAVVTGSASGIGAAVVAELRSCGARVAGIDVHASAECDLSIEADVGDGPAVTDAFVRITEELGPPTLAVHSAGITRDGVHWKLSQEDWDAVLRVNLTGAFHILRNVTPHLREAKAGSVVFIGSINGSRGKFGQSAYAASKAGLVGLAKTAARELGRFGGRVNVVAPGMVETPLIEGLTPQWRDRAVAETVLGRIAQPEDVARVVGFLLGEGARHVTGQVLDVDGGQNL